MNARFLPYDWFKFIVLLILIALLIMLGQCTPAGAPAAGDATGSTVGEADQTTGETASGDPDGTVDDGQTAASETEADASPEEVAQTGEAVDKTGAESEPPAETVSLNCPKALPARISGIGVQAVVTNALIPLRSSPEVAPNFLGALPIGSMVEITSLPVCTEYLDGANLWWGVRTTDGRTGFAAEGSAISPVYYLEEVSNSD